jgi:hypothetical protein
MARDQRGVRSAAEDAPSERVYRDLVRTARDEVSEEHQLEAMAIRSRLETQKDMQASQEGERASLE